MPKNPLTCNNQSSRLPRLPFAASLLCFLVLCGLPAATFAQSLFIDFNSAGEYASNFNPWEDTGGANGGNYSFQEASNAGVGGSGCVNVFQSLDTTAVYNGNGWDLSTNGATMAVSMLIKANGQTSGNKVQVGFLN